MKKNEPRFGMYPLCVDIFDVNVGDIQCFDATSDSIVCAEASQKETNVIDLVESKKMMFQLCI